MRSLLWDGKIPFVKIGRRFLVRPSDLQDYIANSWKVQRDALRTPLTPFLSTGTGATPAPRNYEAWPTPAAVALWM